MDGRDIQASNLANWKGTMDRASCPTERQIGPLPCRRITLPKEPDRALCPTEDGSGPVPFRRIGPYALYDGQRSHCILRKPCILGTLVLGIPILLGLLDLETKSRILYKSLYSLIVINQVIIQ